MESRAVDNRILDMQLFNRMLYLERKRSQRTGNPFVLLIADISKLVGRRAPGGEEICAALQSETRDTDLCGWYRESTAVGVIFTALQEMDRDSVRAAILAKMRRALSKIMSSALVDRIDISLHFFPEEADSAKPQLKSDERLYPDLINRDASTALYHGTKRAIDVTVSLALLILLSPLLALIAILIKASSDGPVLFRQRRIGQFGIEFDCLKFRTMYANCDHEIHRQYVKKLIQEAGRSQKVYKIVDDPRVTPVGRILRKTSLDELPQFVNVLLGDMSLVGPRPPIPYEIDCYLAWHKRRIIETKPGITGLWQVYGRSRTNFDEMVRLDIRYIERQSLWLDLKLMAMTPYAVLSGAGAY